MVRDISISPVSLTYDASLDANIGFYHKIPMFLYHKTLDFDFLPSNFIECLGAPAPITAYDEFESCI